MMLIFKKKNVQPTSVVHLIKYVYPFIQDYISIHLRKKINVFLVEYIID